MIAKILLVSFGCTVITWLGLLFISEKKTNYANHYEKMIPTIEARLKQEQGDWLNDSGKDLLKQVIPKEGMEYRVFNSNGIYLYGSLEDESDIPKNQLLENLNRVKNGPGRLLREIYSCHLRGFPARGIALVLYVESNTYQLLGSILSENWFISFSTRPFWLHRSLYGRFC